ncbi:hypothetical protein HanXRQr2_Chr11g0499551 [Helianthus annuus]|uniref:Uncharacterized protein n=1 Tax=Helianthus annuus TaxID=4232 RepID=A0A9K3HQS6_HELAN|nr:hypothetical protein HanXRQr2_Chr11g0499551 [Helianthus annuus]KAJ0510179.1 hypothetical protein HanIR_Chr11g0537811 [Helianthus annuus]KAJ0875838.1 hypothetical protein HanPSC8_Chr11g0481291 [Helianthus annuus]
MFNITLKLKAQSRCKFHITSLARFPLFPSSLPHVLQRGYHLQMLPSFTFLSDENNWKALVQD